MQSTSDTEEASTVQVSATEPRILLPHGLEIHGHELQADMRDRRFEITGSEAEPVVLKQRPGARQALELEIETAAKIVLEVREDRLHLRIQGSEMTAAMTVPLPDRQLASGRYGSRK